MKTKSKYRILFVFSVAILATGCSGENLTRLPLENLGYQTLGLQNPQTVGNGIEILLFLTIISLAPPLLVTVTAFTRIVIVLSFLRNAIAVPQVPPNQVLVGLALFLTMFTMQPTWKEINEEALQPYISGQVDGQTAYELGISPLRQFLFKYTRERDLALLIHLSDLPRPKNREEVPTHVLIPAFIISELKTAFQMGIFIFLPFLVIDMIVASALMSMGMMMLPPTIFSLPFKLLLFVMADGWHLIVRSLLTSF
jgi:flagellar biosynthetic protein FliP